MKKAGDLLAAFLDERMMETARGYSDLFSAWKSIAGDKIAAHSRIRNLERSVLLVEADHPGWVQILQTKQAELLTAVRRRFPDLSIAGISFRLSRNPPDAVSGVSAGAGADFGGSGSSAGSPSNPGKPGEPGKPGKPEKGPEYSAPPDSGGDSNVGQDQADHGLLDNNPYEKISDEGFKESLQRLEKIILKKGR
jgi:hypothetical protein